MSLEANHSSAPPRPIRLPPDVQERFFTAIEKKDAATVRAILISHPEAARARDETGGDPDMDVDLRQSERIGAHALYTAAVFMPIDVIAEMIRLGADVNTREKKGSTPIMAAALHDRVDVIELLLDHGADINNMNDNDARALDEAISTGAVNAARCLAAKGGLMDAPDIALKKFVCSKLIRSISPITNIHGMLDFLIDDCKANPHVRMNDDWTLMMLAISQSAPVAVVDGLLKHGADINAVCVKGRTALALSCKWPSATAHARFLLEAGARTDIANIYGRTALHEACTQACTTSSINSGCVAMALLGDYNADPYAKDKQQITPARIIHQTEDIPERKRPREVMADICNKRHAYIERLKEDARRDILQRDIRLIETGSDKPMRGMKKIVLRKNMP